MDNKPRGAGKSTFDMIDQRQFFEALNLAGSTAFLDLGCGRGNYALAAAELIGPSGTVYGIDAWTEGIVEMKKRACERGLNNVEALVAQVAEGIPLDDSTMDVCLMATVLHDFVEDGAGDIALRETARILKPGGMLAIVEFKKVEGPPGPPLAIRLSEEEVEHLIDPFGFEIRQASEVGPHHYMIIARTRT